mmetsp:Transcript_33604/g.86048  ORF Transcript_33604/g.86048 Transcript_33604/m.86048 type:complete len:93 (+) Transcript_33604:121-399(+)
MSLCYFPWRIASSPSTHKDDVYFSFGKNVQRLWIFDNRIFHGDGSGSGGGGRLVGKYKKGTKQIVLLGNEFLQENWIRFFNGLLLFTQHICF